MSFNFKLTYDASYIKESPHVNTDYIDRFILFVECSEEERKYVKNHILHSHPEYDDVYKFTEFFTTLHNKGIIFRTRSRFSSGQDIISITWKIWNVAKRL